MFDCHRGMNGPIGACFAAQKAAATSACVPLIPTTLSRRLGHLVKPKRNSIPHHRRRGKYCWHLSDSGVIDYRFGGDPFKIEGKHDLGGTSSGSDSAVGQR
jgi:hypothetical protein